MSAQSIARLAWRLPWHGRWVPHGLLDILRGCNITCRACYNLGTPRIKPLAEVQRDLATLRQARRLDSVSIVGGEPTLHPDLCGIVRHVRDCGLSVEIFTNGLRTDRDFLNSLRQAGANMLFLHIDAQQNRPDLPEPTAEALRQLRQDRARDVTAAGMEAGLAITAYPGALEQIDAAVRLVLESPDLDYLLVTLCRDTPAIGRLRGDLASGMCQSASAATPASTPALTSEVIFERMRERFGMLPFAFVGANADRDDARWVSYLAATVLKEGRPPFWRMLRPSLLEPLFVGLLRRVRGRYPFYMRQAPGKLRLQLLLNALLGFHASNARVLLRSLGGTLRTKRILFQAPAEVDAAGRVVHCEDCPDATVVQGRLVPVCVSDLVSEVPAGATGV